MNLFKSGENDGGFVVVPQSHKMMERAFEKDGELCSPEIGDYYRFSQDIDFWEDELKKNHSLYSHPYLYYYLLLIISPLL